MTAPTPEPGAPAAGEQDDLQPEAFLLTGMVGLVTGAAAGIGRGIARAFASFGADVAVWDRDSAGLEQVAAEIRSAGRQAHTGLLDVRDAGSVAKQTEHVREVFGRVDVLVNNAGGGYRCDFDRVSENGQQALIAENFTSVANVTRAVLAMMGEGSCVINVTSIEAHRAAPGYAVYSAMKAGVANLTKSLALELGPRGIRVNCVAPDVVPTPGLGGPGALGEAKTPIGRLGRVADVAGAVVYLASAASAFVTGTTIHVDGGNLAAGGWRPAGDEGYVA